MTGFELLLGPERAARFTEKVNEGVLAGLTGRELHDHICKAWSELETSEGPGRSR